LAVDSDEYLTYNTFRPNQPDNKCWGSKNWSECKIDLVQQIKNGTHIQGRVPKKIGRQNETIAHWIANEKDEAFQNNHTCVVFSRTNFGAKDTEFEKIQGSVVPDGFDVNAFHTLRYMKHGVPGRIGSQSKIPFPGKPLIDVSKYDGKYLFKNPHRPFHDQCVGEVVPRTDVWALRVHHYSGTLETFTSRPERTQEQWEKKNNYIVAGEDGSLAGWLHEFVKLVGKDKAFELTQGARGAAYKESMKIKARIESGEIVTPIYDWD
jgi:hypothetical protein